MRMEAQRENPRDSTESLVRKMLDGDRWASRQVVNRLDPTIKAQAAYTLARFGVRHTPTMEIEDLVQEIWRALLDRDGELLKRWQPERGATLETYVARIAYTRVVSQLRRTHAQKRRCEVTTQEHNESQLPGPPHNPMLSVLLDSLWRYLQSELPEMGRRVFQAIFVDTQSPVAASVQLGISRQAIYMWTRRIRCLARSYGG